MLSSYSPYRMKASRILPGLCGVITPNILGGKTEAVLLVHWVHPEKAGFIEKDNNARGWGGVERRQQEKRKTKYEMD